MVRSRSCPFYGLYRSVSASANSAHLVQNEGKTVDTTELILPPSSKLESLLARPSVLDDCKDDVSDYTIEHRPSFNLAAYADKSPLLQKLIDLGVNLSTIEQRGAGELILRLDFERNVKPYLQFLLDQGVPAEELGSFITRNPYILNEDLENLQIRVNYLQAKLFQRDAILRIITKNASWLSRSTKEIDSRLGFLQSLFKLSGQEVRHVTVRMPKLVTRQKFQIEEARFGVIEQMGFNATESKTLLMEKPKIYTINREIAVARFNYVHNEMGLSHDLILSQPTILTYREKRIKERHKFLKSIGRAQYDPTQPLFVSTNALLSGTDAEFCRNVAKTSIIVFNKFLKTL
ncbi:unnamed protein product [Nesidiocoris tenuis]|uniref:Transcription termination factor 3, mitochondrial n=1 Tax=Nesidiocoris tenuis TaxID=355587 RepID=A0A6H5G3S8_9HEMI|nr:unnamed protein product [Nesidiocoris tenuis]CAA9997426.1 unnamed protein product [Nesidiocoris tenuis]